MSKTLEGIAVVDGHMVRVDGALIAGCTTPEYAKRVAACWNACDGVHIDILTIHERSIIGGAMFVDQVEYNRNLHRLDQAVNGMRAILKEIGK